jgi:hypothetical protein
MKWKSQPQISPNPGVPKGIGILHRRPLGGGASGFVFAQSMLSDGSHGGVSQVATLTESGTSALQGAEVGTFTSIA